MAITLEQLWEEARFSPNPSQFEAITNVEGPLFLPAGPGSGKTRVLLWRTINLIVFHGIEPNEIFLSTFTEKAAFQLKQGLQSLLGLVTNHTNKPYDLSGMFIGTVHSLCQRLITDRKYSPDKTRPRRPHVLDALSQYFHVSRFLRDTLPEYEFDHTTINRLFSRGDFVSESRNNAINNAIKVFNRFSEDCLQPDDHLEGADDLVVPMLRLYKDYRSSLITNGGVMTDFSLLQAEALDLLGRHPESGIFFKHVIVDEYQDTNTIQERIFFKLAAQSRNLCVVGDDEQALYRFRGATVENFVEFPQRCINYFGQAPREIPLNINYRSRKRIVDFYTRFMNCENWSKQEAGAYRLENKNIQSHSTDHDVSVVATTQGERTNVCFEITSLVTRLINEGKVQDPNQIAFLFPSLKTEAVKSMKASLESAGHLVYAPRAGRFLEVDESVDVFGLFAEILDPPEKSGEFGGKDYEDFHEWIDNCAARARVLMREDANLKRFVADRRAEVETAKKDYDLLLQRVEKEGWSIDDLFIPETMKKVLLQTSGISEKSRKSLGNAYFERIIRKRIEDGNPFKLGYVMNAASSLDWNVLDLFYRLIGFDHFKQMLDLAEAGVDEGPTCNLALISGGSPAPALQQFENQYPVNPAATPVPGPVLPPKPVAPSFSEQIKNLMLTGQQWLFRSVLDSIVKPLMPILMFLAWIIGSFVLILAFIRRFHDNRGLGPEQLVAWGVRTIIFMVVIGASPFIIDGLTVTGKFFARPVKAYNHSFVTEFDEKMKQYVKKNFAVEDPNELLAERLPNGEPGLVGIITDKNSSVKDVTSEMNILGWSMPKLFTFMVIGQNIIKFGAIFLSLAGLFILIGLKLAAPVLSAFGFDEKFANQMFYPFCWGVATFALAFPIVKEVTLYVCYGIGLLAFSIYNGEAVFSLDPTTATIITNGNYDPASSALIVTSMFFVSSLCFILVPWLSYRVLRGQVYEGVSQISMGWMLSSLGTALETYGLVAGAAINRQAENTQIQGIYNAEQTSAKKALEAANQSTEARLISSVAGVEGGLTTSLGQIRANQVTQSLLAEATKNYGLSSSQAATNREITGTRAEAAGTRESRTFDGKKEVELRGQGNLERFGMKTYELTPGGASIVGTSVPIRTGQELFDWSRGKHPIQEVNKQMDATTRSTVALQNNNTDIVADKKVDASNTYQVEINRAIEAGNPKQTGFYYGKFDRLIKQSTRCRHSGYGSSSVSSDGKDFQPTEFRRPN